MTTRTRQSTGPKASRIWCSAGIVHWEPDPDTIGNLWVAEVGGIGRMSVRRARVDGRRENSFIGRIGRERIGSFETPMETMGMLSKIALYRLGILKVQEVA